jgi:hypothetical protein
MCHGLQVFVNEYLGARRGEGRSIEVERTIHVGLSREMGVDARALSRFKVIKHFVSNFSQRFRGKSWLVEHILAIKLFLNV